MTRALQSSPILRTQCGQISKKKFKITFFKEKENLKRKKKCQRKNAILLVLASGTLGMLL